MTSNLNPGRLAWRGRETVVLPGDVRIYARKSVNSENAERSISEQVDYARAQCDRLGLPVLDTDILEEKPGHGGDEFWVGGGSSDREVDGQKKRFRPALTRLVQDIRARTVKVVFVWDMTRLWRSVELCGALVELFLQHNVMVYDRNGHIDIESPEGRQMVNFLAAAAQHHREMCRAHSMRAVQAKRERGESANAARGVGYVSLPGRGITHIPDEIALVRRVFDMFLQGVRDADGNILEGPLSPLAIARRLTAEGCTAFPDTARGPLKRIEGGIVWRPAIDRCLRNPRYIGKQRHKNDGPLYDAKEFLIDGKPAIDPALWHKAQQKLDRNSTLPKRRINGPPISGLLRCGWCAKTYGHAPYTYNTESGPVTSSVWRLRGHHSYHDCDHLSSSLDLDQVGLYVKTHLAPLLLMELRTQRRAAIGSTHENRLAEFQLRRVEVVDKQKTQLPKLLREHWERNPALVAQLSQILEEELAEIDAEILRLELRSRHLEEEIAALENIDDLDESQLRDLVRSVVKWIAVLPDPRADGRTVRANRGAICRSGRMLLLTAWGSYHSVVYGPLEAQQRINRLGCALRPATPLEIVGTIMGLPTPHVFFENLKREKVHATRGKFRADEWAPGYAARQEPEVIELPFSIGGDAKVAA